MGGSSLVVHGWESGTHAKGREVDQGSIWLCLVSRVFVSLSGDWELTELTPNATSAHGAFSPVQVAIDVGAGTGIMSAMAVLQGKLGKVHAVEARWRRIRQKMAGIDA